MSKLKSFTTAAIEAEDEATREDRIKALVAQGKTREEAEAEVDKEDGVITFKLDDRVMRANAPTPGQLVFLMANMGRGQSKQTRFAGVLNTMMECLDEDDKDYLDERLNTRDKKKALNLKQLEEVFEYLVTEWFSDPTQES